MSNFHFAGFTPDFILDAIESLGLAVDSGLLALNSYENRVYQFKASDNRRYVVKFYRGQRWTEEQIKEELSFTKELHQHEIPVVTPVVINDKALHQYDDCLFALFPSVGGRQFEIDNIEQIEWVGRLLGRMHRVAASQPFVYRQQLSLESHLTSPKQQLINSTLIPSAISDAFFAALEQLISLVEQRWTEDYALIRLHGDCHPGNILWNEQPIFVDLDDCCSGPAIQDMWMMFSGDRQNQLMQLDAFAEAYDEFNHFPTNQLALIEPLRAMRMIHYTAWLDKRWQDPAFPRAFPWFADIKYWEQQILAFKEQIASIQEPSLTLYP
ncbi:MAG: serine/threonine protein kinase [Pseudomonadota bacterium]